MKKIGVEKGLDNVAEFLTNEVYSVQMLSESIDDNISKLDGLDAIVAAGYNTNMLGYSDTETRAPVVNASGLSPQEVKDMLDRQTSR